MNENLNNPTQIQVGRVKNTDLTFIRFSGLGDITKMIQSNPDVDSLVFHFPPEMAKSLLHGLQKSVELHIKGGGDDSRTTNGQT